MYIDLADPNFDPIQFQVDFERDCADDLANLLNHTFEKHFNVFGVMAPYVWRKCGCPLENKHITLKLAQDLCTLFYGSPNASTALERPK